MKKAAIIGATGFGGLGLIELMLRHPSIKPTQLFARKETNMTVSSIFPHLAGKCDLMVKEFETIDFNDIDIAFLSTPDRTGMFIIDEFIKLGIPVIDFSGDFRFNSVSDYEVYAKNKSMETSHNAPSALEHAVYGLPEKFKADISKAKLVGNPGCFAISLILGLLPLFDRNLIDPETVIADSKSGVSGAGKNPGVANFYPQRYEDINTYREGSHQHLVEIENIISKVTGKSFKLFFVPQILPITRGILSNMYATPIKSISSKELFDIYTDYYSDAPFVRITDKSPHTANVRTSNFCEIRPMSDPRTGKILVTSVIDNLMKGQAGNAIQVANIMLGLNETDGIDFSGIYP